MSQRVGDEMLMSYRAVPLDRSVIRPLHWSIAAAGGVVGLDHCVRSVSQWYHSATSGYLHFLTLTAIYEPSSLWAWIFTAYLLFAPLSGILLVTGALVALMRVLRGRNASPLALPEQLLLRGSGIAAGLTILLSLQSLYHAAGGIVWSLRGGIVPDLCEW